MTPSEVGLIFVSYCGATGFFSGVLALVAPEHWARNSVLSRYWNGKVPTVAASARKRIRIFGLASVSVSAVLLAELSAVDQVWHRMAGWLAW